MLFTVHSTSCDTAISKNLNSVARGRTPFLLSTDQPLSVENRVTLDNQHCQDAVHFVSQQRLLLPADLSVDLRDYDDQRYAG